MKRLACLLVFTALTGCAAFKPTPSVNGHTIAEAPLTKGQLLQSDPNRMANLEIRDNLDALYLLMDKLYKRNPSQWHKDGLASSAVAMTQVKTAVLARKPLPGLGELRDTKAIARALDADFNGDRVAAFVYGMADMLVTAHGGKQHLYLIDGVDAQRVYNAARNIEIAAWLLAQRTDTTGTPLLLSNDIAPGGRNLSFERLFGSIIGRTDLVAEFAAEKYRRSAINYVQGLLGGQFLQFLPVQAMP